jgi:glycosyltransferase involved in cell wall biosynthesis
MSSTEPASHLPPSTTALGVIVLTFNSASVIDRTLRAALEVSPSVFIVDSGSSDDTVAIATRLGCEVVNRPFKHYADQRNWAIDEFGARSQWQLHLDADEVLDDMAIGEIHRVLASPGEATGFIEHTWPKAKHPVFYLHPVGEGEVLYLTLGHCRGHYDMLPLMEFYPVPEPGSWALPVFYDLLRRGLEWTKEPAIAKATAAA